jgi:hypothetical protein
MSAIFVICGCLFIAALTATVWALVHDAYRAGYKAGVARGTYDACKQQVDTDAFFRCVDRAASTIKFPHK